MEITVLASGSKGNCTLVRGGDGALLVDCGLPAREVLSRLSTAGCKDVAIQGILVTHEHVDHIRGVWALARKLKVPVFGTGGTLQDLPRKTPRGHLPSLHAVRPSDRFELGGFSIEPFSTSHDAREPCGYFIGERGCRFAFCTDTGFLPPPLVRELSCCDGILLESNHCPEMLATGPYPESLKRRIRSRRGHLSNVAAATCLREIAGDLGAVILAHLSEVNNTPEKALASAKEGLGFYIGDVEILVAHQHRVSSPLSL
ncbi:MAG: MBL fold metallo-hydrolase [Methanomicrobiales archaeon]|nr:MBL fold metallo-hydrolase [Methanomicrobiales archaeon]